MSITRTFKGVLTCVALLCIVVSAGGESHSDIHLRRTLSQTSIVPTVFNTPGLAPSTTAVTYNNFPFTHFAAFSPVESIMGNCIGGLDGESWIIRDWRVNLTVAPGTGASWTFMIRKLGEGDTGFCVIVKDTERSVASGTQELVVYPGDVLTLAAIPSTGVLPIPISNAGGLSMVSRWIGPGAVECTGATGMTHTLAGATYFVAPQYGGSSRNRVEEFMPWPIAGSFMSARVSQDTPPGGAQENVTYQLQVNRLSSGIYQGRNETDLQMQVTSDSTADSDQIHSVHVNRGDLVGWKVAVSAQAAMSRFKIGYVFVPDVPGECAMTGHFYLSTKQFQTWESNPSNIESQYMAPVLQCQIHNLVFALTTNTEGQGVVTGKQCTQIVRRNGSNTTVRVTGFGPRVYWEDSLHSASYADGDVLDFQFTGVNSAPGWVHYGIGFSVPQ